MTALANAGPTAKPRWSSSRCISRDQFAYGWPTVRDRGHKVGTQAVPWLPA